MTELDERLLEAAEASLEKSKDYECELRAEIDRLEAYIRELKAENAKDCVDVQGVIDMDTYSKIENTKLRQQIKHVEEYIRELSREINWCHERLIQGRMVAAAGVRPSDRTACD